MALYSRITAAMTNYPSAMYLSEVEQGNERTYFIVVKHLYDSNHP